MNNAYRHAIGDIVSGEFLVNSCETHLILDYDKVQFLDRYLDVYVTLHLETGSIRKIDIKYMNCLNKIA